MIKAILFDFGQTLVNSADGFRHAEKEAKTRIFADLFPDLDTKSWEIFLKEYRRLRTDYHQRSNFSRPSLWLAVYQHFNRDAKATQLEQWEASYWAAVKSHTQPFPETMNVLKMLSASYRLGLVTNTQGQKHQGEHRIALFPELETFFSSIIVAGEAGIPPKPDPEPFECCLQGLDVTPAQAGYVGDDWRIDIKGSHNAGLQPVWLKHRSVHRNWPDVQTLEGPTNVPVITGLDQLPELMKRFDE